MKKEPTEALAVVPPAAPLSVGQMLHAVIEKGVTADNVAALEKLCDLYERMEARKSEQEFNAAFVRLQTSIPKIRATKEVPNNDGTTRYAYAPFEEIMAQVQPLLTQNGFAVTFNNRFADARMVEVCTLLHTSGHSRCNEFAVRIGQGPPKSSETQADGAAMTYAKRGALCNCLNIVIEKDDDARAVGEAITKEQAQSLRERVHATASDERAFLKFAGAATFEEIGTGMYAVLDTNLRRKEKTT